MFGAVPAGAAQREAEWWTLNVHLGQTWMDNLFLLSGPSPNEAISH